MQGLQCKMKKKTMSLRTGEFGVYQGIERDALGCGFEGEAAVEFF